MLPSARQVQPSGKTVDTIKTGETPCKSIAVSSSFLCLRLPSCAPFRPLPARTRDVTIAKNLEAFRAAQAAAIPGDRLDLAEELATASRQD